MRARDDRVAHVVEHLDRGVLLAGRRGRGHAALLLLRIHVGHEHDHLGCVGATSWSSSRADGWFSNELVVRMTDRTVIKSAWSVAWNSVASRK